LALLTLAAAAVGWASAMATVEARRRKRSEPLRSENAGSAGGSRTQEASIRRRHQSSPAERLRSLLQTRKGILTMPCAYDALTARLVERMGFEITFMTGFGVSAAHGYPDCQLVSYQEMVDTAFHICGSLQRICCIGDGDTGYGNAVNVKRTVRGYAQAGMAAIMIEDQVAPKRCGHTRGKSVVSREEAIARIRAACDARDEGQDICILARTDARATEGLEEAIARCKAFVEAGADITFLEAPLSEDEMERYCREVPGPKLVNMLPSGKTPMLSLGRLEEMGFALAAYPLTLLSAGLKAQEEALTRLRDGKTTWDLELDFETLKDVVGFTDYYKEEDRYKT
ncbi:unnamed protein product, partial [Polarella glacialis]